MVETQCTDLLTEFADLYQWMYTLLVSVYSMPFEKQVSSQLIFEANLVSLKQTKAISDPDHFRPSHFGPIFVVVWPQFFGHFCCSWVIAVPSSGLLDPLTISLFLFKDSKALLVSTIIFLEDTSCYSTSLEPTICCLRFVLSGWLRDSVYWPSQKYSCHTELPTKGRNEIHVYCKNPKYLDTPRICCNHPKIWTKWLFLRVISSKRCRGNCKQCRP